MSWLMVFMSYLLPVALLLVLLTIERWERTHSREVPIKVRQLGRRPSPIR